MLSFRHDNPPNALRNEPRRRTVSYFPWQMRWRLFLVVGLVILGPSLLIQTVPALRSWSGNNAPTVPSQPPLTSAEIASDSVDTRLIPFAGERDLGVKEPIVGGVQGANRIDLNRGDAEQVDAFQAAVRDRWLHLRDGLGLPERARLQQVLRAARGGSILNEVEQQAWRVTLQQLNVAWEEHDRDATAALEQLSADERIVWSSVLKRMDADWTDRLSPALNAGSNPGSVNDSQRQALAELQPVLDELALKEVRDNTVLRGVEGDAWFRFFEMLQTSEPNSLQSATVGRVGFIQLFKQPQEYRGKLVTVRGDVRLGYRVAAPANNNGITGYYVYWLQPAGGPNRPMVIYALEKPPGFPALADRELEQQGTALNQRAEFTGYFFKNWAYKAQDHTRLAPLLLAKAPVWQPEETPSSRLPSVRVAIGAVLAAIVFAIALTYFVYYQGPMSSRIAKSLDPATSAQSPILITLPQDKLPGEL